jgi:hypothetical protein
VALVLTVPQQVLTVQIQFLDQLQVLAAVEVVHTHRRGRQVVLAVALVHRMVLEQVIKDLQVVMAVHRLPMLLAVLAVEVQLQ